MFFAEGEGDYGGDRGRKKKRKDTPKERTSQNKGHRDGQSDGNDPSAVVTRSDSEYSDGDIGAAENIDIENDETVAPFFETLLKCRDVKATALSEGRRLALKQVEAWNEPPAAEGEDAISPENYVGKTIKYEKKGIGIVRAFHNDKKQKHTVEFRGRKGKPDRLSRVRLDVEAAAAGMFLVADEEFVETFIVKHVERSTTEFSKAAARQILKDKVDKDIAEAKAARAAERRRKAQLAKPILLAPGIAATKTANTVVPLAGRAGFIAMRGAFAATVAVTATALKATNIVAKASESGINQIEKQMGMLSMREITALCERMDVDGTSQIGRLQLLRICLILEEALSDAEINSMVLEVTGDLEGANGVTYEAFGRWINLPGPVQDKLRPKAKGGLKEEVDWVAGARTLTEQVARLRACRQDVAWVAGTSLKPKDIVGLPVDIPPYGQGIVESYTPRKKKRSRKKKGSKEGHTIVFDIGERKTLELEFGGKHLAEGIWKAVHYEYVNDYVAAALAEFDAESQARLDELSTDAMASVMDEEAAWRPGDFNAEGGAYVGRYIQITGNMHGYCEEFKNSKYIVKPADGGPPYKVKLDGTGTIPGKGKKTSQEPFTSFRVLDDEFAVAFTLPLVKQQMNTWSHRRVAALEDEQAQIAKDHEDEVANQLDEYFQAMAKQDLVAAASCVSYWSEVGTLSFETFRASFLPKAAQLYSPEMVAAAGGLETILRETWNTMERPDRAVIENEVRRHQLGDGVEVLETKGVELLVPASGHELQRAKEGTTLDLRNIDIISAVPGGLSDDEVQDIYRQLHVSEGHSEVPLDLFAKWIVSRHSELAAKFLEAVQGLKWPELAPLVTYVNPDEEPQIAEERYAKAKAIAKGGFMVGSFALKAGVKTTKVAYKVAKPVTKVAMKTTVPVVKSSLKATQVVSSALDSTVSTYGRAGSAMFASIDDNLYAEFTEVDEAARAAFEMMDENKNRFLERQELDLIEQYSGLRFSNMQIDEIYMEVRGGKAPPKSGTKDTSGRGAAGKTDTGFRKDTWTKWYSSDSMYAKRLRRESLWAIDRKKAEAACNYRSTLVEDVTLDALGQTAAWLPQTDFDEVDPHDLVGLTIDVKGNGRGWVQSYGKGGHQIVRETDQRTFCVNLSDRKDKKLSFQVLSQEFFETYLFRALEDALTDWEEEFDLNANVSDSEMSGSDMESSGDATQRSRVDDAADDVTAVNQDDSAKRKPKTTDTGTGQQKKKKKKKKAKKAETDASFEDEAARGSQADSQSETNEQDSDVDAAMHANMAATQGIVTREDLNQLGALVGVALTKDELDQAMLEMDPFFVPVVISYEDEDEDEDGSPRGRSSSPKPKSKPKPKPTPKPTPEADLASIGSIPFKAFNAWFHEVDIETGAPLRYTDENPRSRVLAKIKDAKEALERKAATSKLSKLSKLKSIGTMSGLSFDDPPTQEQVEKALFHMLDDNLIGDFNWDEFTYLPSIAQVQLTEEDLQEVWAILDRNDTGFVKPKAFAKWFHSDDRVARLVRMDENGALNELGIRYRNAQSGRGSTGATSMIDSADEGNVGLLRTKSTGMFASRGMFSSSDGTLKREPRIIYKQDVEEAARRRAEGEALVHEDAWRDGLTVLTEIDREELVGARIDVETFGKGTVVSCGKGRKYNVQFDPGTPLGKKKRAMPGVPTEIKLPNSKFVFTVLSTEFVSSFVEQSVNKEIQRWATRESALRAKVEVTARAKYLARKGAWTAGATITDPEDVIDRRIKIKGYGEGTVVDYDDHGADEAKGKWGDHMIEFDSGKTLRIRLDSSADVTYKVLNAKYVDDLCNAESKKWQEGRRKLTESEKALQQHEESEQSSKGILQLLDAKKKGRSTQSSDDRERQMIDTQLRTLKELFDGYDKDNDGKLFKDEFELLCLEMGFRGTSSQMDDAWGEVDQGEKGFVTCTDLSDFLQSDLLTTIAGAMLRNQIATRIVSYREDVILLNRLFVKFDESKQDHLDFEEFSKLSASLNFEGTEQELQDTYTEIDTDGSGFIEFEEFRRFFIQHDIDLGDSSKLLLDMMREQLDADKIDGDTLRRVFAKHDPDGNGYLDSFEFDVLAQELGFTGAKEEMQGLFQQMDKDNNGLVDWEEFVAYFGAAAKVDGEAGKIAADLRRTLFANFTDTALDLRSLRNIFDKVDRKSTGNINFKQFARAAKILGWTGSKEELDESWALADADDSGDVTWSEFRDWYMTKNPDAVALMAREDETHSEAAMATLKEFFDSFDVDGNGELSTKEFIAMARQLGLQNTSGELKHMFKVMDVDRSGTIEFKEFVSWYQDTTDGEMLKRVKGLVGNDKKSARQRKILKVMFGRIDSDGSGEVDAKEVLQLALDLGVEITLAEMQFIFAEIDLDDSGQIDFDEFCQWYVIKGGRGEMLRQPLRAWYTHLDRTADDPSSLPVGFGKGKTLQGTKRVAGKITYYFSRISGAYSEISSFAESHLTLAEKSGFSTIDKLVYLHQTQLFSSMELGYVLRVAQVCEQINMTEGEVLYEDGDEGHAAYFIVNGAMTLGETDVEEPVTSKDRPFGEETFLGPQKRSGTMLAAEDTILLCLFQVDMARLFKAKLVDENSFMHALGGLVVGSLRGNYAQLEEASSSGTVGQDLAFEVARAGWTYDAADFVYAKKSSEPVLHGATAGSHTRLDEKIRGLMQEKALNATILDAHSYSTVEKIVLLKQCKIFDTVPDHVLREVAAVAKMLKVPRGVLLYKEGEPGYDSFIVCSGQVKLTKRGSLIGLRERGSINGATCLISAGDPRSATVTTTRETLLMSIAYDDFDVVMQHEPELRNGMMLVLMDRLADSYQRLKAVRRLEGRVGYFHEYRKELRLDVRNVRLNAPKPEDYRSFIDDREEQEGQGQVAQTGNPVFQESKVFLSQRQEPRGKSMP